MFTFDGLQKSTNCMMMFTRRLSTGLVDYQHSSPLISYIDLASSHTERLTYGMNPMGQLGLGGWWLSCH